MCRLTAIALSIACASWAFATPAYARHDGEAVVVSLGDSYSSGEGAPPFYGWDSPTRATDADHDFVAHRSMGSWPGQLVLDGEELRESKGTRWFFVASSGAVAADVFEREQTKDPDGVIGLRDFSEAVLDLLKASGASRGTVATSYLKLAKGFLRLPWEDGGAEVSLPTQLRAASDLLAGAQVKAEEVDYVTITIGGNDIGFASIVAALAALPDQGDASAAKAVIDVAWMKYFDESIWYISEAYLRVHEAFPNAKVVVAGYPTLMDDGPLDDFLVAAYEGDALDGAAASVKYYLDGLGKAALDFNAVEARMVNLEVARFNRELARMAESLGGGKATFVDVMPTFDGHEAGTDEPFLNGLVPVSRAQDIKSSPVSAYSMHPNWCGGTYAECTETDGLPHCGVHAYVSVVQPVIDELEGVEVTEVSIQGKDPGGRAASAGDSDEEDPSDYVVHLDGADLLLPEAWWGKVEPVVGEAVGTSQRITYDGQTLLTWSLDLDWLDQLRASGEPADYADTGTETLPDGTVLTYGRGNDGVCTAEVVDPLGNRGMLSTFARSEAWAAAMGKDPEIVRGINALEAEAAGVDAGGDPYDTAFACLRACAERLTFTGREAAASLDGSGEDAAAVAHEELTSEPTLMDGATFETGDFVLTVPDSWVGSFTVARSDAYPEAYEFHLSFEEGGGGSMTVIVSQGDGPVEAHTPPTLIGQSSKGSFVWVANMAGKKLYRAGDGSDGLASIELK